MSSDGAAVDRACGALAQRTLDRHPIPGLAWGVYADGALRAVGGLGTADVARRLPAGPGVASRWCSITKTLTAVAVMQLVEEGLASIDDPVNEHLTHFTVSHPGAGSPEVTLRHLLTHTAGIGLIQRWGDLRRPYAGLAVKAGRRAPPLREAYGANFRTEVPAGTKWAYANHGFAILGQLVEDARGAPYGTVVRERILDPLGMTSTDVRASDRVGPDRFVGYKAKRPPKPSMDVEIVLAATGGAWGPVEELLAYAAAIVGRGSNEHGRILRSETLATMGDPHFQVDPRLPGRGLGFRLDDLDGHRVVGHDGGIPGFTSTLQVLPESDRAVVALSNANSPAIGGAIHRFGRDVLRHLLGDTISEEASLAARSVSPSGEVVAELVGRWKPLPGPFTNIRTWMAGGALRVERRADGTSVLRSRLGPYAGGMPLVPVDVGDPLRFDGIVRETVSRLAFVRSGTGRIDRLRMVDVDGPLELHRT